MARYRNFDDVRRVVAAGTIDEVRQRRAGLKVAMSELELALAAAAAAGRSEAWRVTVRGAAEALREQWMRHVVETEAPGAFLDEIVELEPRLANQASGLRHDHAEILTELLAVEDLLAQADAEPGAVRERLTGVLCALARHRQRGADLVYEALDVDIGGGS
jgi:hypothetical protein